MFLPTPLVEYGDNLSWNPFVRETYTAQIITTSPLYFIPIPDKFFATNSNIIQVGIGSINSKPSWWLGAHVGIELFVPPSSTSQFSQWVEIKAVPCQLGKLTLIEFPRYSPIPYRVNFRFPRWLQDVYVEVWNYDTDSLQDDSYSQQLRDIQQSINNL